MLSISSNVFDRFIIIGVTIGIALISRYILMQLMNRLMMSEFGANKLEEPADDMLHSKNLNFEVYDLASNYSDKTTHLDTLVKSAKNRMKSQFIWDLKLIFLYGIVGLFYFSFIVACIVDPENCIRNSDTYGEAFFYYLFLVLFLFWSTMRYIGYRNQFKAFRKGIFEHIAPIWNLLFAIFQSRWYMVLALIVLINALIPGIMSLLFMHIFGFPLLVAVAVHLVIIRKTRRDAKALPNIELLILRVFLINKTSAFTFSQLAKYWKHFGSYLTVADPSFYRVFWKRKFYYHFPVILFFTLLIYTRLETVMTKFSLGSPFYPFILVMLFFASLYILYRKEKLKSNFIKHQNALENKLANLKKKPIRLDKTFREQPFPCYDNTWKLTVEKLVVISKVVLMDLRGFSESNKGCEYEINLLLNTVKLEKVLFLCHESALPMIKEVLTQNFKTLSVDSPNINEANSIATIYVVNNETNEETQLLMTILIDKAKPRKILTIDS